MNRLNWFERSFTFGLPAGMLPFYLERLAGSMLRIEHAVKNADDKKLSEKFNDKWSIKQNIGHLAEVDEVANKRIDEMRNGVPVLSPAVFEPQDYNTWPIADVLAKFVASRQANLAKYNSLQAHELLQRSLHPRLKVQMSPVDLAWFDAEHDDHHILKIKDILLLHA